MSRTLVPPLTPSSPSQNLMKFVIEGLIFFSRHIPISFVSRIIDEGHVAFEKGRRPVKPFINAIGPILPRVSFVESLGLEFQDNDIGWKEANIAFAVASTILSTALPNFPARWLDNFSGNIGHTQLKDTCSSFSPLLIISIGHNIVIGEFIRLEIAIAFEDGKSFFWKEAHKVMHKRATAISGCLIIITQIKVVAHFFLSSEEDMPASLYIT
jgi:hypothetical protein